MDFPDHFSAGSADYARFRPGYPDALFRFARTTATRADHVWDCGTGNGQAARKLVEHFARVTATDASAAQIASASPHPDVTFAVAPAEASGLPDGSVDLVFVAQALHWFDHDGFYAEVRRVAAPDAAIVAVSYLPVQVDATIAGSVEAFRDDVRQDWPPERRHVDAGYTTLPFPFQRLDAPALTLEVDWPLEGLLGYLGTWSATKRHRERTGTDAVARHRAAIGAAWGAASATRRVRWPMAILAGRVG